MKINKAKSTNYNRVNTDAIVRYIQEYSDYIYQTVHKKDEEKFEDYLVGCSRTHLKAIATELETVVSILPPTKVRRERHGIMGK